MRPRYKIKRQPGWATAAPNAAVDPAPPTFTSATALNDDSLQVVSGVTQPGAGAWYTDPAFGTRILRMTDASTDDSSHVPYSYWPSWNLDTTKVWFQTWPLGGISGPATKTLWDWSTAGVPSNRRSLQAGSPTLEPEGLIWSRSDANLLYGFSSGDLKLYSLVPEGTPSVVTDLTTGVQAVLPTGHHFWQMSMGGTDRYFAWTVRSSGGANLGIAVYDLQTDTLYCRDLTGVTAFDEAHLTRDGALLLISSNPGPALLWDFIAHPTSPFSESSFGQIVAHEDFGPSTQMWGPENPETSGVYSVWDLAAFNAGTQTASQASTPRANIKHATATTAWPTQHGSWQNLAQADPVLYLSTTMGTDQTAAWRPYFDEIWKVWTDGTGHRRLAHHRSEVWGTTGGANYRSHPKGTVSPNGRWFAYSSNWQKAALAGGIITRIDVYILKVPTDAEFASGGYLD